MRSNSLGSHPETRPLAGGYIKPIPISGFVQSQSAVSKRPSCSRRSPCGQVIDTSVAVQPSGRTLSGGFIGFSPGKPPERHRSGGLTITATATPNRPGTFRPTSNPHHPLPSDGRVWVDHTGLRPPPCVTAVIIVFGTVIFKVLTPSRSGGPDRVRLMASLRRSVTEFRVSRVLF